MEKKRDLAIILRTVPFQERHRIVTALTEQHGLVTAMAKNAVQSRRFGGALEPFAASLWHFTEKEGAEMLFLEKAEIRRSYEGLRKDFERLSLASLFNEVMLKLAPPRQEAPELFRMHSNALAELEDAPGSGIEPSLLNAYLAKVLHWSGSSPQLENCLHCERPLESLQPGQAISCVVADAGWVCPDCRAQETRHVRRDHLAFGAAESRGFDHALIRITSTAVQDFQRSLVAPIRQASHLAEASRNEHLQLFRFLEALCTYHLPGLDRQALKSLKFLDLTPAT
jgi:DNA repair protein RecO